MDIYQGPTSGAPVETLWGARLSHSDPDVHNFNSYKIPVKSGFNIDRFKKLARGYWNQQLFQLLEFGFPLDVGPGFVPSDKGYNHSSAEKYPGDVEKYIKKELKAGALKIFDVNKLKNRHISPLMSRPKDASGRRIILASINACVPFDSYLNTKFVLKLPTIDNITNIINSFTTPVYLFKIDLARAFRQIPLDPLDPLDAAYLGIQ
jgi:hypothetical protein